MTCECKQVHIYIYMYTHVFSYNGIMRVWTFEGKGGVVTLYIYIYIYAKTPSQYQGFLFFLTCGANDGCFAGRTQRRHPATNWTAYELIAAVF